MVQIAHQVSCYSLWLEAANENMLSIGDIPQFPYFEFLKGGKPWKEKKVKI